MTTGPVNINLTIPLPFELRYNDGTKTDYMNTLGKRIYEIRPASSSIPFDSNGFRVCGNWLHQGAKWEKGSGSYRYGTLTGNNATYSGCIDEGTFPSLVAPSSNLMNKGLTKALQKLKDQQIHIGTFLAEGGKTASMVMNAATSIARQVRNFKRKFPNLWDEVVKRQSKANRSRRRCDIPGKWLELQYGWTPLISDIYGALEHLKKGRRKPIVTVSSSVEDEDILSRFHTFAGGASGYRRYKQKWIVKTYLHYGLASDPLAELSSLGLINPAEIAWELLPYSFVVDWFLPVGNWLSVLTADVGFSFLTGGQSRKGTIVPYGEFEEFYRPVGTLSFNSGRITGKAEHFERHCYGNSPTPGLYVKNPLSGLHIANATALLIVAFRPKR